MKLPGKTGDRLFLAHILPHLCTHQTTARVLVFCTEPGDTHRKATSASHVLPACGQHQGHAAAAQPKGTLSHGGSGYMGQTPHGLQWHLLMATLGVGEAVTQTTNEYKPHCKAPLTKALGKEKQEERGHCPLLEDIFSLKEALGECLFGCEQKRMLEKKNKTGDLVLFFCCLPGPKNKTITET